MLALRFASTVKEALAKQIELLNGGVSPFNEQIISKFGNSLVESGDVIDVFNVLIDPSEIKPYSTHINYQIYIFLDKSISVVIFCNRVGANTKKLDAQAAGVINCQLVREVNKDNFLDFFEFFQNEPSTKSAIDDMIKSLREVKSVEEQNAGIH